MPLVLLEYPADHVTLLRMNRPKALNALNAATRVELVDHFRKLGEDDNVRCLVITPVGRFRPPDRLDGGTPVTPNRRPLFYGQHVHWFRDRESPW